MIFAFLLLFFKSVPSSFSLHSFLRSTCHPSLHGPIIYYRPNIDSAFIPKNNPR